MAFLKVKRVIRHNLDIILHPDSFLNISKILLNFLIGKIPKNRFDQRQHQYFNYNTLILIISDIIPLWIRSTIT